MTDDAQMPMNPMATLGVVVVNFGSHDLVDANLGRLDLSGYDIRVVIVDNFHSVAEREAIAEVTTRHGWKLLPLDRNVGFGSGMNLGVAAAWDLGCDIGVLINPDLRIEPPVLSALRDACAAAPMTLFSPRIVRPDGRLWFGGGQILIDEGRTTTKEDLEQTADDRWLTGACLAVTRQLWAAMGGFDDEYFLYWEDIDLSVRCVNCGGDLRIRQDLTAVHSVGGTQGGSDYGRAKSTVYYRYNCRNRLLFAAKHLSGRQRLKWALGTPRHAKAVLLRGGKRQFRRPFGILWAATSGSAAGLWAILKAWNRAAVPATMGSSIPLIDTRPPGTPIPSGQHQ